MTPVEARTPKRTVARRAPRGQASEEAPVLPLTGFEAWRRRRASFTLLTAGLTVLVVVSMTLSLGIGPVAISPGTVVRIVL